MDNPGTAVTPYYTVRSISSRFSNTVLTNTASSGPLKKQQQSQQQQQQQQQQQLDSCPQLFVAEPSEIVFTNYQMGKSYTVRTTVIECDLCVIPIRASSHVTDYRISSKMLPSNSGRPRIVATLE